jgi:hypothetical protein
MVLGGDPNRGETIVFSTHNTHEGPEAPKLGTGALAPRHNIAHECRDIQQGADHDPAHP